MSTTRKILSSPLISPESLHKLFQSRSNLPRILDTTFHLKPGPLTPYQFFQQRHIPTARYFDIEACKDPKSDLPHMMPSEEDFSRYMQQELEIVDRNAEIVLYDQQGIFAAPRVWFMLRAFGHDPDAVYILNGGLPAWQERGYETVSEAEEQREAAAQGTYHAKLNKSLLKDYNDITEIISRQPADTIIVDARPKGRFTGEEPEPRPNLESGHMPGAVNLPFGELLQDGVHMRNLEELRRLFASRGITTDGGKQPQIVFSCGSGVTACVLARAADMLGFQNWSVYDGSWSEYASRKESKIAKGAGL